MNAVHALGGYAAPITQIPDSPDDRQLAERLRRLLLRHELAATRLRAAVAKQLGMSEIEGLAIAQIALHGEVSQVRLSELLDLSTGGTAALVQRLEQEGRVVRRQASADRRIRLVTLSAGMAARSAAFEERAVAELQAALEAVRPDGAAIGDLLERFVTATESRADRVAGGGKPRADALPLTPSSWG